MGFRGDHLRHIRDGIRGYGVATSGIRNKKSSFHGREVLAKMPARSNQAHLMSTIEKHEFQAEIAQLLDIVIHSLYTDKEIFIRELISNAADATEKLRFLQTSGTEIFQPDRPLTISVNTDDTAHTISIADSGIGMTRDELIENLGTIAHSGSKAFLQQIKENAGNPNLIGQFGVGFYSSFMVGTKVTRLYPLVQAGGDRLDLDVGWRELLRHRARGRILPAGRRSSST